MPGAPDPTDEAGSVAARKAALRRRLALARDLVDDRTLRSVALWAELAATPEYARARTVLAFTALAGEPETDALVARLERDGKRLVLPSLDGDRIVPRLPGEVSRPGRYGVVEPSGFEVDTDEIDLVVVPGVAFTSDGRRLGRGGGHYDRFLASLPDGVPTIGVCFGEQLLDDLPSEAHDVRVGRVVSC